MPDKLIGYEIEVFARYQQEGKDENRANSFRKTIYTQLVPELDLLKLILAVNGFPTTIHSFEQGPET